MSKRRERKIKIQKMKNWILLNKFKLIYLIIYFIHLIIIIYYLLLLY